MTAGFQGVDASYPSIATATGQSRLHDTHESSSAAGQQRQFPGQRHFGFWATAASNASSSYNSAPGGGGSSTNPYSTVPGVSGSSYAQRPSIDIILQKKHGLHRQGIGLLFVVTMISSPWRFWEMLFDWLLALSSQGLTCIKLGGSE